MIKEEIRLIDEIYAELDKSSPKEINTFWVKLNLFYLGEDGEGNEVERLHKYFFSDFGRNISYFNIKINKIIT